MLTQSATRPTGKAVAAGERLQKRQDDVPSDLPITVWINTAEVLNLTGWSRQTLYAAIENGDFPKPCKLGQRKNAWRAEDYQAWSDSRDVA